jgi:hypothetical protein
LRASCRYEGRNKLPITSARAIFPTFPLDLILDTPDKAPS